MYGEEPGEPLPVKLIRSYMAHRLFWVEIHREAKWPRLVDEGIYASPARVTAALALLKPATERRVTAELALHSRLSARPVTAGQQSQFLLVAVCGGYNEQKQEESLEESDTTDELLLLTCSSVIHDVAMEQLAQVLRLTVTTIDGELRALTDVHIDEAERKIYGRGQKISTYGEYV